METPEKNLLRLARGSSPSKYVGFVDLLGFSNRVLRDFDGSLDFYAEILNSVDFVSTLQSGVSVTIYSDSFLLVAEELSPLVGVVRALLMQTLFHDCLVRGGIAYGKHVEVGNGNSLYVVSEALVKAAMVEKNIKYPCVALDPDIRIPDEWWGGYSRNIDRSFLYFGGLRIVNPCNLVWGRSAGTRVAQMLADAPQYRDKFEWFLELHKAIFSPVPMVPPEFFKATDAT